jgi:hypothetical protein
MVVMVNAQSDLLPPVSVALAQNELSLPAQIYPTSLSGEKKNLNMT